MDGVSSLVIGQVVRVIGFDKDRSCRATISTINEGQDTIDVVYDDIEWSAGNEEESDLALHRIRPIFPFELLDGRSNSDAAADVADASLRIREQGNELFRIGDYGSALSTYRRANQCLVAPIQIGKGG